MDGTALGRITATVRAASRLDAPMYLHRVKRLVRAQASRHFAEAYRRYITSAAAKVPPLAVRPEHDGLLEAVKPFFAAATEAERAALRRGEIVHFGIAKSFGSLGDVRWEENLAIESDHQLWRLSNCYMHIAYPLLVSPDPADQQAVVDLIGSFRRACPIRGGGSFKYSWHPYAASQRILALCTARAVAERAGTLDPAVAAVVDDFLAENVGFVLENIEHELGNNHVERNLAALCLYLSLAAAVPARLAGSIDRMVHRIVARTILPDGMMVERSAMYQGMTVMSLRIFARTGFLSPATAALVRRLLPLAERSWALLGHPDGDIALFNDSWLDEVPHPRSVVGSRSFAPVTILPEGGFARLESPDVMALFDCGPIGPDWNPGHGHTDFLALEVDVAGRRFLVDPGTSQYSSGAQRVFERSAASHNGPRYVGREPVDYVGCFRVGRIDAPFWLSRAGFAPLLGDCVAGAAPAVVGEVRRAACLLPSGALLVADLWSTSREAGATRLLVAGEWQVAAGPHRLAAVCDDGTEAVLSVCAGELRSPEPAGWSRRYLTSEPATAVELTPEVAGSRLRAAFVVGPRDASDEAAAVLPRLFDALAAATPHPPASTDRRSPS
jgi:hypothetical protein